MNSSFNIVNLEVYSGYLVNNNNLRVKVTFDRAREGRKNKKRHVNEE